MPETTVTEQIEIPITLGTSFHCSSKTFEAAQRAANQSGLVHYIGSLPNGEVTGCDRDVLEEMGCDAIAFVAPERRTAMQKFGDFVMYGPEGGR